MFGITVSEAAAVCGGSVFGKNEYDAELKRIVIDSRDVSEGDLFVAYKGEKSDGHDYIISALKNGAACALAEHLPEITKANFGPDADPFELLPGPVIICRDVQEAVEKIAAAFRRKIEIPVVGITGSVGKTTTKEMIAAVLGERFRVHKTAGNLNNTIGLPMSLSCIEPEDEFAVLEMGINHFGEMRRLGKMAAPDIAVFTIIGHAHLEFLGDLNGVLKAKTEMLESMSDDALLVVNGDDKLLRDLKCPQWKLTFGRSEGCEVRASNVRSTEGFVCCDITYDGKTVHASIPGFGEHLVYAALAAAAVGFAVGLSAGEIEAGLSGYKTVGRRLAIENTGFVRLIDDCYNANPDSCHSSIDTLSSLPGRHVCIFGDMLELGDHSDSMHLEVGKYAAEKGVDLLLTCGNLAALMADAFNSVEKSSVEEKGTTLCRFGASAFPNVEAMTEALPRLLRKDDCVLVKASRGVHLERVSEAIKLLGERHE
ncbi:MAG: UDP-N-acetylmuramoyl-tripeptide--D-alanyl-D-alanine ligase [Eubacteriales bacterium]|nr:UDP-N-acetylmuramoyl-tripeptide--D-alanyl-D-alanine ligase [Eubacteriales bacterium]